MKVFVFLALFVSTFTSMNVFAEGKTRAQVYQELITAQQNGLNYVTDTSYPEVHPSFTEQVARRKEQPPAPSPDSN